jgi:hypothetical protein
MTKTRRHHNNTGQRQIKRGKTHAQVAGMAKRLLAGSITPDRLAEQAHRIEFLSKLEKDNLERAEAAEIERDRLRLEVHILQEEVTRLQNEAFRLALTCAELAGREKPNGTEGV